MGTGTGIPPHPHPHPLENEKTVGGHPMKNYETPQPAISVGLSLAYTPSPRNMRFKWCFPGRQANDCPLRLLYIGFKACTSSPLCKILVSLYLQNTLNLDNILPHPSHPDETICARVEHRKSNKTLE